MTESPAASVVPIPEWTFGDRLRKVRRHVGDTQTAFAAKLDESAKTYSNWEADRHPPASIVAVAKRVELATGVPAGWLLGVMDSRPTPDPWPTGLTDAGGATTAKNTTGVVATVRALPLVRMPAA